MWRRGHCVLQLCVVDVTCLSTHCLIISTHTFSTLTHENEIMVLSLIRLVRKKLLRVLNNQYGDNQTFVVLDMSKQQPGQVLVLLREFVNNVLKPKTVYDKYINECESLHVYVYREAHRMRMMMMMIRGGEIRIGELSSLRAYLV